MAMLVAISIFSFWSMGMSLIVGVLIICHVKSATRRET
jgi:hypothetical protein